MITINSERGLVRFENWGDIVEVPGYRNDVDPKDHNLKSIIGTYQFPDKHRCGLSSCHTPHNKGYVVTTLNGDATNIGKDCGAKHFGVNFEEMRKAFDQDLADAERREALISFQAQIAEYREYISLMRTGPDGADWIHRTVNNLKKMNRGIPVEIVEQINSMEFLRSGEIIQPRYATKDEKQREESRIGRKIEGAFYVNDVVDSLAAVEAIFPENDLRQILVVDLDQGLERTATLNDNSLSRSELRRAANWITAVPQRLQQADRAIDIGRRFLMRQNLAKLTIFVSDSKSDSDFERFLSGLPN